MNLPNESASPLVRVTWGRYVIRRLTRAQLTDLASNASAAGLRVLVAHRTVEDLEFPLQDAIADRDVEDETIDDTAQQTRLTLSARSVDAARKPPYTDVFPHGIEYYTTATLADQVKRYGELVDRLKKYLPPDDPVVATVPDELTAQLSAWKDAYAGVGGAEKTLAIARTERDSAEADWERVMEATYGALVERFGRKKAERFFPRRSRKKPAEPAEPEVVKPS